MSEMTTKTQAHPWFVWESEYAEDGCTIIAATSAEAAQEEYRRMSGADPETPLDAKPVTAEDVVRLEEENARLRVQAARIIALERALREVDEEDRLRSEMRHYERIRGVTFGIASASDNDARAWQARQRKLEAIVQRRRALITAAGEEETR